MESPQRANGPSTGPRRQRSLSRENNGRKNGNSSSNNSEMVAVMNSSLTVSPVKAKNKIASFEIESPIINTDLRHSSLSTSSSSSKFRIRRGIIAGFVQAACHHIQAQWAILLAGQILSFLMACSGAAQATLSFDCDLSAPTLSLMLFYFCLAFCLVPICRENAIRKKTQQINIDLNRQYETATQSRTSSSPQQANRLPTTTSSSDDSDSSTALPYSFLFGLLRLSTPAYVYFFMALLDVYANYFTVRAFKYTTITSVTLLDALAIPSAMILSKFCLNRDYSRLHLIGALLCMVGVVLNVLQDYEDDKKETANATEEGTKVTFPFKFKGDVMAVMGGVLFGASSVVGEVAVRDLGGPNEYVGMLGFFAAIICVVQTILIERDDVAAFFGRDTAPDDECSESTSRILLVAFVIINVVNYLGRAWFLQVSEAAFLNLSLLTGDMWSVLFSVFAEKIAPHAFFYVALTITLSGVFVYEMSPSPIHEHDLLAVKQNDSMVENESDDDLNLTDDVEDHDTDATTGNGLSRIQ